MSKLPPARRKPARKPQKPPKTERRKGPKYVYPFAQGCADGGKDDKELLGGKGANLAEMCNLDLPVPPGFTLSTQLCTYFYKHDRQYPRGLRRSVLEALRQLEEDMGKGFGEAKNPLLVSVRSGARVSMPGMMDTVLNLGLNDESVLGLAALSGNERFAWDAYRRFIQMYGDVVLGIKADQGSEFNPFHVALEKLKKKSGAKSDTDLTAEHLKKLVATYQDIVQARTGNSFPQDPMDQLWGAIGAVFSSWHNERAVAYRQMNQIPSAWGTAVNVVAMVFGNTGEKSGTGVAFTRDPSTGEKRFYGEYLMNAQGEDVVAGIRTPQSIESLAKASPKAWKELMRIEKLLESHYRDMQDLEFTIEDGKLYMLQCRSGKRTGFADVRIAVEMVNEKLITKEEAVARVNPEALNQLLQPVFDPADVSAAQQAGRFLTRGLNAGPGAATGQIAFKPERAEEMAKEGKDVILVRVETSPEDIRGMQVSKGILTARGGMTSHAALVARQMGKVCVAGAAEVLVDYTRGRMTVEDTQLKEGDWISIDGTSGDIFEGRIETSPSEVLTYLFGKSRAKMKLSPTFEAYRKLLKWADEIRRLRVRANADQPDQCMRSLAFGAEGIGLCRTEHMFFEEEKISAVREMILSETSEERERALTKLLPLQRKDFEGIFKAMGELPVTIRCLDPPLHEFLPHDKPRIRALAKEMGVPATKLEAKVESLAELNPMLGHRGCRLGITYPEITRMQARAIFEAACNVAKRTGKVPRPEIMIPLIASARELELQATEVRHIAEEVFRQKKIHLPYLLGTMIELPRAALTAGEIAEHADFFSFGTNDLTQTAFGISRDDAGKFIPIYVENEILESDPFARLDIKGTGRLMRIACEEGRESKPDIKLGICGEHGGDPPSIDFCEQIGLEYVSCSPFRIPIARLAAAQAALAAKAR